MVLKNKNWKRQYLDYRLFQSSLHRQGEHKAGSLFRIRCVEHKVTTQTTDDGQYCERR